jgi:ParB-like chromosome segregation protein Spo0J
MKTEKIAISKIKLNPNNPRLIKDDKFAKLVQSIKDFPEMLEIRPIVVNDDMIILGGNMRFKACKEAGLKEVSIIKASGLSAEKQREFLIKDNVSGGEWDWQLLNDWDSLELESWGLDISKFNTDYSDKNEEIDIDSLDTQMVIKLKYTEEEYNLVKEQLSKIASTPEQAIWKLLGNE